MMNLLLITLLYLAEAGTHEVVVVVDPENIIVETDEKNNYKSAGKMGSNNGILDVGVEIYSQIFSSSNHTWSDICTDCCRRSCYVW